MQLKRSLHILLLSSALVASAANADAIEPNRSASVTLDMLMQHVYEKLPARAGEQAYQQQQQATDALVSTPFASPVTVNVNAYNDALLGGDGAQEWEGGVELPLWLPGQKQAMRLLSDKFAAELPAYQQKLKLDASSRVRTLLWDVMQAETNVKQAEIVWQTAQKLEKDVIARVDAGELATAEKLLAQANTLETQAQYQNAQASLQSAMKKYRFYTGVDDLPARVDETIPTSQQIDQSHPVMQLMSQRIQRLQETMKLAQYSNAVNPSVNMGVRHERGNSNESFNDSLNLGFSIALGNQKYSGTAVAEASKNLADVQIQQQQMQQELSSALLVKQNELSNHQAQLALLEQQDAATQHYVALQQKAFDLGELNLVDLLRAQSKANQTRSRLQLQQVMIKRTIAELNQLLGIIL
jgi:outer membrane protein TolC